MTAEPIFNAAVTWFKVDGASGSSRGGDHPRPSLYSCAAGALPNPVALKAQHCASHRDLLSDIAASRQTVMRFAVLLSTTWRSNELYSPIVSGTSSANARRRGKDLCKDSCRKCSKIVP